MEKICVSLVGVRMVIIIWYGFDCYSIKIDIMGDCKYFFRSVFMEK